MRPASISIGLVASFFLFAAGEIPGTDLLGNLAQMGSTGVLTWVAWMLFKELQESRRERTKTLTRLYRSLDRLRDHCIGRIAAEAIEDDEEDGDEDDGT